MDSIRQDAPALLEDGSAPFAARRRASAVIGRAARA
jgi:hypothetical protein